MSQVSTSLKEYFYIFYYAIFFNFVAVSHYWFAYEYKNILRINYNVEGETDQTEINIYKNQFYAAGLIVSGLLWPYLTQKLGTKKSIIISAIF